MTVKQIRSAHLIKDSESLSEVVGLGSKIDVGSVGPLLAVGVVLALSAIGRIDIESNIGFIIAPNGLESRKSDIFL